MGTAVLLPRIPLCRSHRLQKHQPLLRPVIVAPPADRLFTALVISDDQEETGTFTSSSDVLNAIVRNARWGILGNYKGMPVDCPQRNERQPWLGDRTKGCWGESYLFDNERMYTKWVRDIDEAQREDGCIPDVAPAFWNYYSDNVTWPAPYSLPATCCIPNMEIPNPYAAITPPCNGGLPTWPRSIPTVTDSYAKTSMATGAYRRSRPK